MHTESKRCIYHYPGEIIASGIGSALRPYKMLEAFIQLGYEVDVVSGSSAERKRIMKQIRRKIYSGVKYDFLYAEDRNIPYALSDDDHLPRHPFADISFFGFCKQAKIPVGVFYRDAHWRFPLFREVATRLKRFVLVLVYQWELSQLHRNVNICFAPSEEMASYIWGNGSICELPPGCTITEGKKRKPQNGKLDLLYVGNIADQVHDIRKLCQAVKESQNVFLTICAPKESWVKEQTRYQQVLCERIRCVHKNGKELGRYFEQVDALACCLDENDYIEIAMPLKVFESIGYATPVISTKRMAVSRVIEEENWGWAVDCKVETLKMLFEQLKSDPKQIMEKTQNAAKAALHHTWQCRAQQAADELINWKKG